VRLNFIVDPNFKPLKNFDIDNNNYDACDKVFINGEALWYK
jgi:hypothetical protein